VSEAIHFRRTRINQHPPLDANFFRRARKNADAGLVTPVARQANQVGQSNLFRDDPPVSLEEHLGRIYFAMRNEATPATRRAYFDLVRLYQSELLKNANNYLSPVVLGDDVVRHRLWPQKRVLAHDDNLDLTKSFRRFS